MIQSQLLSGKTMKSMVKVVKKEKREQFDGFAATLWHVSFEEA